MLLKYLKIIVLIITKVYFITSISFASIKGDCFNSSFYIKNINVDLTKESINQARFLAEQKARLIGFNRLLNRLIINNKKFNIKTDSILQLVDYIKINEEANSDKRYLADFDICFNRDLVINFFRKNKLQYAETYREPISILPIFKGPRGFILFDEKDLWYSKWKYQLNLVDGLVKLNLAKGNLYLSRNLNANLINKLDKIIINKLIKNEKTNALLIVIAEPILKNDGKTYLSTYAKFYNNDGKLLNTIYRNKIPLSKSSSIYNIDETLYNKEILNIISSIETSWKKDNLIDTAIYNQVDLLIPISSFKTSKLESDLLFNDKVIKVKSTSGFLDQGILNIDKEYIFYNKKSQKGFQNLSRNLYNSEKKLKYKKNTPILQKDIKVWSFVLETLKSLPFVIEVKVISITNSSGRILVKFMGDKKAFFQAANEKKLSFKNFNTSQFILSN